MVWAGVIVFHVAPMAFGWGFWLWSVPALSLLVPAALSDVRHSAPGTEVRDVGPPVRGPTSATATTSIPAGPRSSAATLDVMGQDGPALTRRR